VLTIIFGRKIKTGNINLYLYFGILISELMMQMGEKRK
jgi:hypothetical protein